MPTPPLHRSRIPRKVQIKPGGYRGAQAPARAPRTPRPPGRAASPRRAGLYHGGAPPPGRAPGRSCGPAATLKGPATARDPGAERTE